jgi:hypothetical protein
VTTYLNAVRRAADSASAFATAEVRQRAVDAGWDEDIAEGTEVILTNKGFETKVAEPVKDRAFVAEFGNEELLPTAVLRKYDNDSATAQELFLTQAVRNIEELL